MSTVASVADMLFPCISCHDTQMQLGVQRQLGKWVGKRIYIYRSGATNHCALTGAKDDPRLPPAATSDRWRFWMQIGPIQAQGSRYGFGIQAAVHGITTNGYYLFTGSRALLGGRLSAPSKPPSQEGQANA